jgi:hypothetical protein
VVDAHPLDVVDMVVDIGRAVDMVQEAELAEVNHEEGAPDCVVGLLLLEIEDHVDVVVDA